MRHMSMQTTEIGPGYHALQRVHVTPEGNLGVCVLFLLCSRVCILFSELCCAMQETATGEEVEEEEEEEEQEEEEE